MVVVVVVVVGERCWWWWWMAGNGMAGRMVEVRRVGGWMDE